MYRRYTVVNINLSIILLTLYRCTRRNTCYNVMCGDGSWMYIWRHRFLAKRKLYMQTKEKRGVTSYFGADRRFGGGGGRRRSQKIMISSRPRAKEIYYIIYTKLVAGVSSLLLLLYTHRSFSPPHLPIAYIYLHTCNTCIHCPAVIFERQSAAVPVTDTL